MRKLHSSLMKKILSQQDVSRKLCLQWLFVFSPVKTFYQSIWILLYFAHINANTFPKFFDDLR